MYLMVIVPGKKSYFENTFFFNKSDFLYFSSSRICPDGKAPFGQRGCGKMSQRQNGLVATLDQGQNKTYSLTGRDIVK